MTEAADRDPDLDALSLAELEQRLREAEARLPAHSVRPAQLAAIEALEQAIARRQSDDEQD
jgi:hypothetical protein